MMAGFKFVLGALLALVVVFFALVLVGGFLAEKQAPPTPEELATQEKNQRIKQLYDEIYETAVKQPTRPMADFHQQVLEMHVLWKDVRDTPYWTSRPTDRENMDQMISKLVEQVDRDKRLRETFSTQ